MWLRLERLRRWSGVLPFAGGFLDQPEYIMRLMRHAGTIYDFSKTDSAKWDADQTAFMLDAGYNFYG
ncbi:MAG: hypothetical protein M9928_21710 [Anaerolineae bacterium]|nr:hypothetical protein [Anaerolineae bacterium]MCO5200003.1 hypothetical protein [Anaerolineae bacterium]MCO5207633.1 hypothetical protein [Anaerolineae bacterium]